MLKLECVNCGAPLEIGPDLDSFACGYCGAQQRVRRQGGVVSLQKVETAIKAVQRGTDRTAAELALPRLHREIAALEQERDSAITAEQERQKNAFRDRRTLTFVTFLAVFFGCPILIASLGDDSYFLGVLLTLIWLVGSIGLPILVYRKSKLPADQTPALKIDYAARLQKIHAHLKAHREILDELP